MRANKVTLKGGISGGVQLESTYNDLESQQIYGVKPEKDTWGHITNQGFLDSGATGLLKQYAEDKLLVDAFYHKPSVGVIQVGERVAVSGDIYYAGSANTVETGNYNINEFHFQYKKGILVASHLCLSSGIFYKKPMTDLAIENSIIINQMNEDRTVNPTSEATAWTLVGNGVDKIIGYIQGGIPRLKIINGDRFYIDSDDDTYIIIDLFDGTYRSRLLHNKTNGNFNIDSDGILNLQTASDIVMKTNSTGRWKIGGTAGHFYPLADDSFNVGMNTARVAEVYHCGLTAGTCADFSKFSLEELINIISYQPLTGTYEKMKNGSLLPHIDMKSIHPLLSDVYQGHEEEIEKENGKIEKIKKTSFQTKNLFDKDGKSKSVEYLKNDGCGIDFENLVYAQNQIIKLLYEKIEKLEKKINGS